ncbi:hypothetical protein F383_01095 [Gossypium arboreum]|uniref:Uncharacterized protein n=1 Tax=Gossypium arboreum TaxID=29729 RepID=A0A0B0NIR6_GOSAR|nr:hypothetical protein F383_01095 [Gossypium arboreum]
MQLLDVAHTTCQVTTTYVGIVSHR